MKKLYAKHILAEIFDNFDKLYETGLPNEAYLEDSIDRLEKQAGYYDIQSRDPELPARIRARNRDLYQNCLGLINGLKFGISFMNMSEENLDKLVLKN